MATSDIWASDSGLFIVRYVAVWECVNACFYNPQNEMFLL